MLTEYATDSTFAKHLEERMGSMYQAILSSSSCVVDWDNEIVTFLIYSYSGKLAGTEQYNWKLSKNLPNEGKYIKHIPLKGVPWGIEFKRNTNMAIVTEGIFDCIRCLESGYDSYPLHTFTNSAVLQSLSLQNYEICYLLDYDCAGISALKNHSNIIHSYAISDMGKDPNSLSICRINELINSRKPVIKHRNYGINDLRNYFSQP